MGIRDIEALKGKPTEKSTPEIPNGNNNTSVMPSGIEKDNDDLITGMWYVNYR